MEYLNLFLLPSSALYFKIFLPEEYPLLLWGESRGYRRGIYLLSWLPKILPGREGVCMVTGDREKTADHAGSAGSLPERVRRRGVS